MKSVIAKPRRPLRYELYALAYILAIPIALCVIFPMEAVNFEVAQVDASEHASCAFVELSDDEATQILANARAAWRVNAGNMRHLQADLSVATMPEEPHAAVMSIAERVSVEKPAQLMFHADPLPPSFAAPAPRVIREKAEANDAQTFSRKELLSLD